MSFKTPDKYLPPTTHNIFFLLKQVLHTSRHSFIIVKAVLYSCFKQKLMLQQLENMNVSIWNEPAVSLHQAEEQTVLIPSSDHRIITIM